MSRALAKIIAAPYNAIPSLLPIVMVVVFGVAFLISLASASADEPETIVPAWQMPDESFVWVKILIVNKEGQPHEAAVAPDCHKAETAKARGTEITTGVYVQGLKPEPEHPTIRTIDEREADRRRHCRNTLPITINGEIVAWPADTIYAYETRFGIPKTEDEVRIRMPVELKLREHGAVAQRSIGPIELPAKTQTPEIVIPTERFTDDVATIRVIYTVVTNP